MIFLVLFSFFSGILTIFTPSILPLLPALLSNKLKGHRKSSGVAFGIGLSFFIITLGISSLLVIFNLDPSILRFIAAIAIGFLGLTMLIPSFLKKYELLVSRLSVFIGGRPVALHHGFFGGFITGLSIGIIWSPCSGPILATIATFSQNSTIVFEYVLVTLSFSTGFGVSLFLFSLIGSFILKKSNFLSPYAMHLQKIFGVIMLLSAFAIYKSYDKIIQEKLLDLLSSYSNL